MSEELKEDELQVLLLSDEGETEQLFELRTRDLKWLCAVSFEEEEITYQIFNDPHFDVYRGVMESVVQHWLSSQVTDVLGEILSDDDD